jgi:hypothetical protein
MTQGLENAKKVAYAEYDFAKDGGAVGDIVLRGANIPKGAIITNTTIHVITVVTSGGAATIALKVQSAADALAATGKASFTEDALIAGIQDGAAANMLRLTANRQPYATVGTAALTAGKFVAAFEYIITE